MPSRNRLMREKKQRKVTKERSLRLAGTCVKKDTNTKLARDSLGLIVVMLSRTSFKDKDLWSKDKDL